MLCTFVVFDFIHPIAYSICELVSFRNLLLTSSAGYLLDATTISLFLHNTVSKIRSKMPLSNSLSNGYLSNRISRSILSLISSAYACTSDPISSFPDTISYKMKTDPLPFHRNRIVLYCLPFESPSCFRSAVSTLLKHYNYISTLTVPDLHSTVPIAE